MSGRQDGFGAIVAIVLLVVLAAFAAALVRLAAVAQATSADALLSARAAQTAAAGAQWGLYQALKGGWAGCANASQTLDLRASSGFLVTVSCDSRSFNEGESAPGMPLVVRFYTIDAVACSSTRACPDAAAAAQPHYVERRHQAQASDQ